MVFFLHFSLMKELESGSTFVSPSNMAPDLDKVKKRTLDPEKLSKVSATMIKICNLYDLNEITNTYVGK